MKQSLQHPSASNKLPEFKVILLGASGVGKTCIVLRAAQDTYNEQNNPTIGFAFQKVHREIDGQRLSLFLWDTAGYVCLLFALLIFVNRQERYKSIIQMYYRGAHCACIVFDVSSRVRSYDCAQ